jgi:hypothetical protein
MEFQGEIQGTYYLQDSISLLLLTVLMQWQLKLEDDRLLLL